MSKDKLFSTSTEVQAGLVLLFLVITVLFAYGCGIGVYQAGARWGAGRGRMSAAVVQ